jgi:hypothetical protein
MAWVSDKGAGWDKPEMSFFDTKDPSTLPVLIVALAFVWFATTAESGAAAVWRLAGGPGSGCGLGVDTFGVVEV